MMSLQEFSFLGSGISGIAGFIGLSIAFFQLNGLRKSVKNSNLMAVFEIEFELNRRKERLAEIRHKTLEKIGGRESSQITEKDKSIIESFEMFRKEAYEDYLNIFDRLSYFILKGNLDEEDFRLEFRDMLFDTVENDSDSMFGTGTRYRNMIKLYNNWKEK